MKKMRLKMIGIVFASVVAAFMVMTIILVMCFGAYRNRQADQITAMISENNGTVPQLKDYKQQQKTVSPLKDILTIIMRIRLIALDFSGFFG